MELHDLEGLIKGRRSIRRWREDAVPEDLLMKAIELATWAPNAGNRQNWRFYLVVDGVRGPASSVLRRPS